MSHRNPLHVTFDVASEALAHTLDLLIHNAGGDPNVWFNAMLRAEQLDQAAQVGHQLEELAEFVSAAAGTGDGVIPPAGSTEDLRFEQELDSLMGPEGSAWRTQ